MRDDKLTPTERELLAREARHRRTCELIMVLGLATAFAVAIVLTR